MAESTLPQLNEVAHLACDDLHDVMALLEGARSVLIGKEEGGHFDRLLRQARERINAVVDTFGPYI